MRRALAEFRPLRRDSLCPSGADARFYYFAAPEGLAVKINRLTAKIPVDKYAHLTIIQSFQNGMTGRSELRGQQSKTEIKQ